MVNVAHREVWGEAFTVVTGRPEIRNKEMRIIVPMLCAWERSHRRYSLMESDNPCALVRLFRLHTAGAARDTFLRWCVGMIKLFLPSLSQFIFMIYTSQINFPD